MRSDRSFPSRDNAPHSAATMYFICRDVSNKIKKLSNRCGVGEAKQLSSNKTSWKSEKKADVSKFEAVFLKRYIVVSVPQKRQRVVKVGTVRSYISKQLSDVTLSPNGAVSESDTGYCPDSKTRDSSPQVVRYSFETRWGMSLITPTGHANLLPGACLFQDNRD